MSELDVLRPVLEAELLVLDDLGAEKKSEWVDETMGLVINTRYSERRLTVLTTNLRDVENTGAAILCVSPRPADPFASQRRCATGCPSKGSIRARWVHIRRRGHREMAGDVAGSPKNRRGSSLPPRPAVRPRPSSETRDDGKADLKWPGAAPVRGRRVLGLYVHIPFCSAICNYCNFNRGLFDADLKRRYVGAFSPK